MLNITKDFFIEKFNQSKSISELKSILNCSDWTIYNRIKKYNLKKKEINEEMILSKDQRCVIIGSLLGDGCLIKGKRCKNPYFQYLSSEKEHVEYIYSFLKDYMTNKYKNGPIKSEHFDVRTNKTYTRYTIRTKNNICFKSIMEEWYAPKKIIPNNIILNPLMCKIWYLGDGGIIKSKNQISSQYIKLSTDGFDPKYVININSKLSKFNAKIQYRNLNKSQCAIIIPRLKILEFLSYIGDCPIECYKHKWKYIPCKSEKIEKYGISNIKKFKIEIINCFLEGSKISQLSKKYNCDSSLIRYHLKKSNLI